LLGKLSIIIRGEISRASYWINAKTTVSSSECSSPFLLTKSLKLISLALVLCPRAVPI